MTPQDVDWWLQTAQTLVKFDDETRQYIILYVVSRNSTLGGARQLRPWCSLLMRQGPWLEAVVHPVRA